MTPQSIEQLAGRLTVFIRHIGAGKRFAEGFVFARAEQVHLDTELVERPPEIGGEARQPFQAHGAIGRKMYLIGHRGEVIRSLSEMLAARQHRFARSLEIDDGGAQFVIFGKPGSLEVVGFQHEHLDARIVARGAHGFEQAGQHRFFLALVGQQIPGRIDIALFDQIADGPHEQRRATGHGRRGLRENEDDRHERRQREQIHPEPACVVDEPPKKTQQPAKVSEQNHEGFPSAWPGRRKIRSHTPYPRRRPRFSNLVSGLCPGRGAKPSAVFSSALADRISSIHSA